MKKTVHIFNIFITLFLFQLAAQAQPAGRTSATKIADLLAQQPAKGQAEFRVAMRALEGFTAEDIANLLQHLKPQGGENAAVEYAAYSYAFYVMQPGMEAKRAVFAQGLIAALDKITDKDNKAFVLALMKQSAKNEAIVAIVPYLKDDYLADKAALALNAIRTPEAARALSKALGEARSEKNATVLVAALGDLKSKPDENAIIATLDKYPSENHQRTVYTALSKIAGSNAAPAMLKKLKSVNYAYDKTNIGGLTLDYANNLLAEGQQKLAVSVANTIAKEAEKAGSATLQAGALRLLAKADPGKTRGRLVKIATGENARYGAAAFALLAEYGTAADNQKLIAVLKKSSPEIQENILGFLAEKGSATDVNAIENALGNLKNPEAKIAALKAHTKLSGGRNAAYLIDKIAGADDSTNKVIQTLLLSSKNEIVMESINAALAGSDVKTQLVLLGILARRTDEHSSKAVFPLLDAPDDAVKTAALKALPNVVQVGDFGKLIERLDRASPSDAKYIQDALAAMLNASPNKVVKTRELAMRVSQIPESEATKYLPVFAKVGGEDALTAVSFLTSSGQRDAAVAALAGWSDAEALPVLIGLSRTEKDEQNFDKIFRGLVRLVNASGHTPEQKTLLLKDAFAQAKNAGQKRSVLEALQATGTYQAMLFATKYMDDPELGRVATNTAMNIATETHEFIGTDVRNILGKAINSLSGSESAYQREFIATHLSKMPKGEGFVSLFNGKDLTGWKGLVEDPIKRAQLSDQELAEKQLVADQQMRDSWSVINGELVFSGKGDNIATVKQYGDFELLVDWKLDPKGHEPDAGIYLRGTPQVQIWDVNRNHEDARFGSGGLWNNQKNPNLPLKVADNPLGEWNTFKIRMTGEKVWVWLNGILVVDNVTLENYWDRNQPIFPMEQIELQAHGSRVWYRDIYVRELERKEVYALSEAEKAEGFEMLFDGTNLDKWMRTTGYEITAENLLRAKPEAKSGENNIYTKDQYADFVFRFEFMLTPAANNGVGIRTLLDGDPAYAGTEIQILDNSAAIYRTLQPYQYHGSAYGIIPAKRTGLKPIGQWNAQEIRVQGSWVKVTLNGEVILDGDLAEAAKNGTPDGIRHPGLNNRSGHIAFLGHASEVFFRNVRVKRI